jgi:putative ATP-dependent endonuclease of OLD family
MHLSTIDIKNFRSFEDVHVDLEAGLNVLVGRNNTGKTNLLQAIRHALGPSASRGDALWLERDHFYRSSAGDDAERTISITLIFTNLTEAQRAYFYEIVEFDLTEISKSKAIVRFEASWPKGKRQPSIKRTGGPPATDASEVPSALLSALPEALAPGYRNRLAALLSDVVARQTRDGKSTADEIKKIFVRANRKLERQPLIRETKESLQRTTREIAGTDHSSSGIKAAEFEFEKILRTLHVQMEATPLGSISANGLGYNNLLYIAVILEHLKSPDPDECPILLVEEPEAHLHPQLTMLLADYLSHKTPGTTVPQTIITTHSPTLAASVPPKRIRVLFSNQIGGKSRCTSIDKAGMDESEECDLRRMMDVTRATLYFAKGAILVEGISEAMLVPVLAKRLGYDLAKFHISVIPICGVGFETFKKLLAPDALGISTAIVTDADPPIVRGTAWTEDSPEMDGSAFKLCNRLTGLIALFSDHPTVQVFHSAITLEYDLAEAGVENASAMASIWESCFSGSPQTFNKQKIAEAGADLKAKAMATWRGICRASHSGSKAAFAQRLAAELESQSEDGNYKLSFDVPLYIKRAITYVVSRCNGTTVDISSNNT